jgi:hypothetical protein
MSTMRGEPCVPTRVVRQSRRRRTSSLPRGDWHRAEDMVAERARPALPALAAGCGRVLSGRLCPQDGGQRVPRGPAPLVGPAGGTGGGADAPAGPDQLAALARMAPGQRAVLVLRYWEGLDVPATAEALGCSTGTLKGR